MKFKAIIFDFDGLMFDTENIWKKYFFEANEVFNINLTEEDRIQTIGKNEQEIRKNLRETIPTLDVDKMREWLREKVFNHCSKLSVDPKTGLHKILDFVKEKNLKSGIASGSEKKVILNLLSKANIDEKIFSSFVTGDMKINPKPAPDVFLKACEDLNVKPCEAVVLEDSYNGVRSGHNAGCFTIMIPDTMPPTKEMKEKADLILNDLNEVVEFLKDKV